MKTYLTIPKEPRYGTSVYTFDKLDGSNIRAEWSRKRGFWKFGRRNGLLDDSNPILLAAPLLIEALYADDLDRIFRKQRWQKAVAFFEFWGLNSAYGLHDENERQTVTLIDVAADKKGILPPRDFVRLFEDVGTPALLHHGPWNKDLEQQVREGTLPGMTFEGVVCKGPPISPGRPLMFKVKSQAWLDKLRDHCGGDEAMFERLA